MPQLHPIAGDEPCFLSEFALRTHQRTLPDHIPHAGRDLPQHQVERRSVLANHHQSVIIIDCGDCHYSGRLDERSRERVAIRIPELLLHQSPRCPLVQCAFAQGLERPHLDQAREVETDDGDSAIGIRFARRCSAAPMKSRNNGCGRSGRLLNSGCA